MEYWNKKEGKLHIKSNQEFSFLYSCVAFVRGLTLNWSKLWFVIWVVRNPRFHCTVYCICVIVYCTIPWKFILFNEDIAFLQEIIVHPFFVAPSKLSDAAKNVFGKTVTFSFVSLVFFNLILTSLLIRPTFLQNLHNQ